MTSMLVHDQKAAFLGTFNPTYAKILGPVFRVFFNVLDKIILPNSKFCKKKILTLKC